MAFTPKRLAQFQAAVAETSHYTVPADTLAVVKNIVIANVTTVDVSLGLSIVPAGGVAGLENRIIPGLVIPPLSVVPLDMTQVMAAGDYISASASLANALTVTISGMEQPGSNGISAGTVIGDPPLWGSPVATGNANADGAATSLPRADHVHKGILAVDQYGAPIATGAANAAGTSLLVPRADHVHQTVGTAAPLDAGLTAAAVGTALLAAREDHRHRLDDTGWIAPTFQNGWVNYGANWAAAGYRRIGGVVYLRGLIRNGTLNAVGFNVPAGFRVALNQERHMPTLSNGILGGVRIYNNGDVRIGSEGSTAWFSLDGVYWVAEA